MGVDKRLSVETEKKNALPSPDLLRGLSGLPGEALSLPTFSGWRRSVPPSTDHADGRLREARSRHRAAASASQVRPSLDFLSDQTEQRNLGEGKIRDGAAGR